MTLLDDEGKSGGILSVPVCAQVVHEQSTVVCVLPRRPGESPSGKDVKMNMEYGLAGAGAVIDNHAVALRVQALLISNLFCSQEEMPHNFLVRFRHALDPGNMVFGNDKKMNRCLRIHVFEGDRDVVFEDDL